MDITDIPPFSEDFLKDLEKRFPPKCPGFNETDREIFHYAGKVELIQWLRRVYTLKNEDLKEMNITCV